MFRVLTWNIHGGVGTDGIRSTDRIAQLITDCRADVVCLQEVHKRLPWSRFIDQPRLISKRLGWPFHFYACLNFGIGGFGLGIVSRFPVRGIRHHKLPSTGEQRGILEAVLEMDGGVGAKVYCTHWGLHERERAGQANFLRALVASSSDPVIVCGDLNAERGAECVSRLIKDGLLVDCASAASLPTYPATAPNAAIDYILHNSSFRTESVWTIPTVASDHLPVVAELQFS